jgi:hypothetical protein
METFLKIYPGNKNLRKLSQQQKFSLFEISRKVTKFSFIFAYRENEKWGFRLNPTRLPKK